jgi:hypothetical protein
MDHTRASSPTLAVLAAAVFFVIMSTCCTSADAYAFAPSPKGASSKVRYSAVSTQSDRRIHRRREDGSSVTLYLFPTTPSTHAANLGPSTRGNTMSPPSTRRTTKLPAMSQSVLAPSDTLPSFATAHGILSPEVVSRIADSCDVELDGALHKFLKTYKSRGPMACLPMLSDPSVLPELTRAMRDIA